MRALNSILHISGYQKAAKKSKDLKGFFYIKPPWTKEAFREVLLIEIEKFNIKNEVGVGWNN